MLILCNPIKNTIMDRPYKQTQSEVPHASEPMAAYGRADHIQQSPDRTARHDGKRRE